MFWKSFNSLAVLMTALHYVLIILAAWTLTLGEARAFEPEILKSVVAVMPHSPGGQRGGTGTRDAPEGTAVAIFPDGYLATNAHVLGEAKSADIRLADGRLIAVKIVGRDLRTDLVLLKAPIDLPVLTIAEAPPVGSSVCAVGNQFGLGLSVTCGVVSAINRTNAGFNPVEDFVQTDAAINPGGSGGALVDQFGNLVGLVSAIFTKTSDANIGVNFAASMRLVMRVVEDLRSFGKVRVGKAGLLTGLLDRQARLINAGARVVRLSRKGAALNAGLEVGDIITRIGTRPIIHPGDVSAVLYMHKPGDEVHIKYSRGHQLAEARLILRP